MSRNVRFRRGVRAALCSASLLATMAAAQTAAEHAEHHASPPASAVSSDSPMGSMSPGQPSGMATPPSADSAMEMRSMMAERMGVPEVKELYPALMELPDLPVEKRGEVLRRAHERMNAGTHLMQAALERLSIASSRDDFAAMQNASEGLREGLAQFNSGLAAHRALAEGKAPRSVALTWFKREMNLLGAGPVPAPHGWFGLSIFHYITMTVIAAFAALLAAMTWARQRRAAALAARLAAPAEAPAGLALPVRRPATTVGGWTGALRVARIFQETADVKTFRLAPIQGDDLPFSFEPGQFLTVAVPLEGKTARRSYSIASSPCCHGWCEITVKRAPGGSVSGYLHEKVRVGDVLDLSGAFGRFTFRGHEATSVVMIAGGVGITPMMSSIRYLTDQSWTGDIFLIYASTRRDAVIFRDELEHLARRHPNLRVAIVLSDEPAADWPGARGFVTAELIHQIVPNLISRRVHLCGPPPMMDAVKRELAQAGLPDAQLHTELFLSPEARKPGPTPTAEPALPVTPASCRFARSGKTVPLAPDRTVLEAAEAAGIVLEYSCRQGFCGVCKARLLEGEVTMAVEDGLAPADKAAGYILTCQAKSHRDVAVDA